MKRILHRPNHLKAGAVKDVFEIAKCTKATREFMLGGHELTHTHARKN